MRYYSIKIEGAPAAFPAVPGASVTGAQWDTFPNGSNNPDAQQIEFSLLEIDHTVDPQNSYLTIHGVSFAQIKQAADLALKTITIYGGMAPGLPIATAQSKYQKFLIQGQIYQAFGNWVGTDMSLTILFGVVELSTIAAEPQLAGSSQATGPRSLFNQGLALAPSALTSGLGAIIGVAEDVLSQFTTGSQIIGGQLASLFAAGGNIQKPLNLIHNMQPGQLLSDAIKETLSRAFPKANLNIAISPNLKLAYQDAGIYQSLPQYAAYIRQLSNSILGGGTPDGYTGVHISSYGQGINVWDTTQDQGGVKQLGYLDLIGQPTWLDQQTISIKTILRGDIHIKDQVQLPPTLVTTSVSAGQNTIQSDSAKLGALAFQGTFTVQQVLHTGDFRNPDGGAWCSTYQATIQGQGQTNQNVAATQTAATNQVQNPSIAPPPATTNRAVRTY